VRERLEERDIAPARAGTRRDMLQDHQAEIDVVGRVQCQKQALGATKCIFSRQITNSATKVRDRNKDFDHEAHPLGPKTECTYPAH
jgi:hypothetical protein